MIKNIREEMTKMKMKMRMWMRMMGTKADTDDSGDVSRGRETEEEKKRESLLSQKQKTKSCLQKSKSKNQKSKTSERTHARYCAAAACIPALSIALSKSVIRSSAVSSPTERRMTSSPAPAAARCSSLNWR